MRKPNGWRSISSGRLLPNRSASMRQMLLGRCRASVLARRSPGNPSTASEARRFEARGWPFVAMRGEVAESATSINPFRLNRPIWGGLALDAILDALVLFLLYQSTFGLRRFLREASRAR